VVLVGGSLPNPMRAWVSSMAPRRVTSASRPASGNLTVSRFLRGFLSHLQTKRRRSPHDRGTTHHQFDHQSSIRSIKDRPYQSSCLTTLPSSTWSLMSVVRSTGLPNTL